MIFFTVLGVITFIYLILGVVVLGYLFCIEEYNFQEVQSDPLMMPLTVVAWPLVILEQLGYL